MTMIALTQIEFDPRNPNVCSSEVLEKLTRHIGSNGYYPPLIVRPKPAHPEQSVIPQYIIIDGQHRYQVLKSLGKTEVQCEIWDVSEGQAGLLLASLNRLHGLDNPRKRAVLIESLLPSFSLADLAQLLPESDKDLEDLLKLLDLETEALEEELNEALALETKAMPVILNFLLSQTEADIVNGALSDFQETDSAKALVRLAQSHFEGLRHV